MSVQSFRTLYQFEVVNHVVCEGVARLAKNLSQYIKMKRDVTKFESKADPLVDENFLTHRRASFGVANFSRYFVTNYEAAKCDDQLRDEAKTLVDEQQDDNDLFRQSPAQRPPPTPKVGFNPYVPVLVTNTNRTEQIEPTRAGGYIPVEKRAQGERKLIRSGHNGGFRSSRDGKVARKAEEFLKMWMDPKLDPKLELIKRYCTFS